MWKSRKNERVRRMNGYAGTVGTRVTENVPGGTSICSVVAVAVGIGGWSCHASSVYHTHSKSSQSSYLGLLAVPSSLPIWGKHGTSPRSWHEVPDKAPLEEDSCHG